MRNHQINQFRTQHPSTMPCIARPDQRPTDRGGPFRSSGTRPRALVGELLSQVSSEHQTGAVAGEGRGFFGSKLPTSIRFRATSRGLRVWVARETSKWQTASWQCRIWGCNVTHCNYKYGTTVYSRFRAMFLSNSTVFSRNLGSFGT